MKTLRITVPALILVAGVAACSTPVPVDTSSDASTIAEMDSLWNAALEAKDLERATAFFAPHAIEMPANAPAIVGRDAIRTWISSWLNEPGTTGSFTADSAVVASSGDLAYSRGTYRFTQQTPAGPREDHGKYVTVWEKINGDWQVVVDISNSDLPVPQPNP
jgi:ketosteroid isomerase-like protein